MDTAPRVQIIDETVCIVLKTIGKGMNPIILPPAMGEYSDLDLHRFYY